MKEKGGVALYKVAHKLHCFSKYAGQIARRLNPSPFFCLFPNVV